MVRSTKASRSLPLAAASNIWSQYGLTDPADLVLEDLAMAMGIFVVDARLDSSAARLVRQGEYGLVRVSDAIRNSGQRRFAIAHEIGHFVMHQRVSQLLACTDADVQASYKSSAYEIEASIFAGGLLMPKEPFRKYAANRPPNSEVIAELSSRFDTSLTATALRYAETSKDYCAFVVSENDRIRWWRASDSFGNHDLWLDAKSQLPRCSPASQYHRDGRITLEPVEIDIEDWFGELSDVASDFVFEQAIPLPQYGQVVSMLWLP
jgi:Zn-dependent peptidase ImmA (M78 family)